MLRYNSRVLLASYLLLHLAPISVASTEPFTFETKPDIHGNQVVFTAEGDLWIGNVGSGEAKRLTSDPGQGVSA